MLRISVEKAEDKVIVTINDTVVELPVYRGDQLLPHGYIHLFETIYGPIRDFLAPVQIGAFCRAPVRMKSYKQAAALRAQLATARRAAETVPHHYYGA